MPLRDAKRCTGCGMCATICPAGLFAAHEDNRHLTRALATLPRRKRLALFCPVCPPSETGTLPGSMEEASCNALRLTGCPAALHPAALAACAAWGVTAVDCLTGDCASCALGSGAALARTREVWNSLYPGPFTIHNNPGSGAKSAAPVPDVRQPGLSRRFLLALPLRAASRGRFDPLPQLDPGMWREPDHPVLPKVFRAILQSAPETLRPDAALPTSLRGASLTIDAAHCTACAACARACPSGALTAASHPEALHMAFVPGLCTGCGVCRTLCPEQAVSLAPSAGGLGTWLADTPVPFPLQERNIKTCARCTSPFKPEKPGDTLCRFCKMRKM